MFIKLRSDKLKFTVPFPNFLIFNRLAIHIALKAAEKQNVYLALTNRHKNLIVRELRRTKKLLGGLPLVEIKSGEDENITVKL